jgi:hypothetical protein
MSWNYYFQRVLADFFSEVDEFPKWSSAHFIASKWHHIYFVNFTKKMWFCEGVYFGRDCRSHIILLQQPVQCAIATLPAMSCPHSETHVRNAAWKCKGKWLVGDWALRPLGAKKRKRKQTGHIIRYMYIHDYEAYHVFHINDESDSDICNRKIDY